MAVREVFARGRYACRDVSRVRRMKTGKGKRSTAERETHRCFHCYSNGAKMCFSQCHRAWYFGKPCQNNHWKLTSGPA